MDAVRRAALISGSIRVFKETTPGMENPAKVGAGGMGVEIP